ncbi:MAG: FG-GAP repeat domain-containing protein [Planctomycetota bacterium]
MNLEMEWGTSDVVQRTWQVEGAGDIRVYLEGPEDAFFSLDPTQEIRSVTRQLGEGWHDFDFYLSEPRFWLPPDDTTTTLWFNAQKRYDDFVVGYGGKINLSLTGVPVDSLGPATSISEVQGAEGAPDVYTSDIYVRLGAEDDFSGVAETYYRTGEEEPWQQGDLIELTTPGTSQIQYYSTDRAGNSEEIKTASFDLAPQVAGPDLVEGQQRLGTNNTVDVEIGDVNGDGLPDVLSCNMYVGSRAATQLYINEGHGSFRNSGQTFTTQSSSGRSLTEDSILADLDGDGDLDIGLADYDQDYISGGMHIFENDGSGSFHRSHRLVKGNTKALAIGDFNGDGFDDVVLGAQKGLMPFLNTTSGNSGDFSFEPLEVLHYDRCTIPRLDTADFNQDGRLDILAPGRVFLNGEHTLFSADNYIPLPTSEASVKAADLNGDGWPDVVTDRGIFWNVFGTFVPDIVRLNGPAAFGDVNGDGIVDIVSGGRVMLGVGDGYFHTDQWLSLPNDYEVASVALYDLDTDGDQDVFTAGYWQRYDGGPNFVHWNDATVVPEPCTFALVLLGVAGSALFYGKRSSAAR